MPTEPFAVGEEQEDDDEEAGNIGAAAMYEDFFGPRRGTACTAEHVTAAQLHCRTAEHAVPEPRSALPAVFACLHAHAAGWPWHLACSRAPCGNRCHASTVGAGGQQGPTTVAAGGMRQPQQDDGQEEGSDEEKEEDEEGFEGAHVTHAQHALACTHLHTHARTYSPRCVSVPSLHIQGQATRSETILTCIHFHSPYCRRPAVR